MSTEMPRKWLINTCKAQKPVADSCSKRNTWPVTGELFIKGAWTEGKISFEETRAEWRYLVLMMAS